MSARLFIALDLAADDRAVLHDWASACAARDPALRVVPPQMMHLTLAFLRSRPVSEVDSLAAVLRAAAGPVAGLETAGLLWLSPARPHVLAVAVAARDGSLDRVHARLWDGLETLAIPRERRRFRPHVTVARVRGGVVPQSGGVPTAPAQELTAASLTLYRSWLGGYEALDRESLATV